MKSTEYEWLVFQNEWMCKAYNSFTTGQGDSTFTYIDNNPTEWFSDHKRHIQKLLATESYLERHNHDIGIGKLAWEGKSSNDCY